MKPVAPTLLPKRKMGGHVPAMPNKAQIARSDRQWVEELIATMGYSLVRKMLEQGAAHDEAISDILRTAMAASPNAVRFHAAELGISL